MSEELEQSTPQTSEPVEQKHALTHSEGTEQPAPAPVEAAQPVTPAWIKELDTIDSKELRRHPKVAGIIGGEVQRATEMTTRQLQQQLQIKAAQDAQQQTLKLAQEDPEEFARQYLGDAERRRITDELGKAQAAARAEMGRMVGQAFVALPDWKDLIEDDHNTLAQSVVGKQEHEVIGAYNAAAVNLLAAKRAAKQFEDWKAKELASERAAIRKEEAARLATAQPAPDLRKGTGQAGTRSVRDMTDAEFNAYWKDKHGR